MRIKAMITQSYHRLIVCGVRCTCELYFFLYHFNQHFNVNLFLEGKYSAPFHSSVIYAAGAKALEG